MVITKSSIEEIIESEKNKSLQKIGEKIFNKERLNEEEGLRLF